VGKPRRAEGTQGSIWHGSRREQLPTGNVEKKRLLERSLM